MNTGILCPVSGDSCGIGVGRTGGPSSYACTVDGEPLALTFESPGVCWLVVQAPPDNVLAGV
jgi:hypothetical protein